MADAGAIYQVESLSLSFLPQTYQSKNLIFCRSESALVEQKQLQGSKQ